MVAIPDYSPSPREVKTESQGKYTEVAGLPAISYEIAFDQGTHLTAKEVHQEPRCCLPEGGQAVYTQLAFLCSSRPPVQGMA